MSCKWKEACDKIMEIKPYGIFVEYPNDSLSLKQDRSWSKGSNSKLKAIQAIITDSTEKPITDDPLAKFARWAINKGCGDGTLELDGGDIQEKAEELKLIESKPMTREDWENGGAEFYGEEEIGIADWYHFTDILTEGDEDERKD